MLEFIEDGGDLILVRNVKNTKDDKADDGSNLDRWKELSKVDSPKCSRYNTEKHEGKMVGAHIEIIEKKDERDEGLFIIPLCSHCNGKKGEEFYIKKKIFLMPAEELHN